MSQEFIIRQDLRETESNPNIPQARASAPTRHVWVRASAGSGKTKVLTDRILRLLLPDPDLAVSDLVPGVPPEKILCLTFTKAGAAEMRIRLQKRLLDWAVADDNELKTDLEKLTGKTLPPELFVRFLAEARRLFARILEAPAKLQILTIHSFCQSVLSRFPIETGLAPNFKVIEEFEAREIQEKSLQSILADAVEQPNSDLGQAFARLSLSLNLSQLQDILQKITNEPLKLQNFLKQASTLSDLRQSLTQALVGDTRLPSLKDICAADPKRCADLKQYAEILQSGTASNHTNARSLLDWLAADPEIRLKNFNDFRKVVFANPRDKGTKDNANLQRIQAAERQLLNRLRLAEDITATADILYMAGHIFKDYEKQKSGFGVLDYNDLIIATKELLSGKFWPEESSAARQLATSWVLYKLDEGIDHILVDESQDTNPDQWDIIRRLSEEFFSGTARPSIRPRSLFVVGDEKQSIFSFQRADPEEYRRMRDYFSGKVAVLQEGFEEAFLYSFRTTAPVLKLVDATFNTPELLRHIGLEGEDDLRHYSHRSGHGKDLSGSVELWPLVKGEEKEKLQKGWQLPFTDTSLAQSPQQKLAAQIATQIHFMIQNGEAVPGDIMILMRTRSALMLHIIRELKRRHLPVSGIDRLVLGDSLIMQDILALCDFILLPSNDFALACFLKSPFIGLNEEQLMALAINRKQSLWSALRESKEHTAVVRWLNDAARFARGVQPYEFLDYILTRACPADRHGSGYRACQLRLGLDVVDPLDEILNEALKFELQDIRTLQDFVVRQRSGQRQIKRELDESTSQIRIMTVHASKGLEAKIVILADTVSTPDGRMLDKFLWPAGDIKAALWTSGSTTDASDQYQSARQRLSDKQDEEYSRLLYVAMTRARDKLMVYGCQTSKNSEKEVNPRSWYARIQKGFERLPNLETSANGALVYKMMPETAERVLPIVLLSKSAAPDWIYQPAPFEASNPTPVSPSRFALADEPVYSPLDRSRHNRFMRGNVTHKLLQILPDLPPQNWQAVAENFVSGKAFALSGEVQMSIVDETLKVLHDPVFSSVFGPGSLAEVPVTGIVDGKLISGQIDRLIIMDNEILIVDFKTNRPSPRMGEAIPESYLQQLKAYRDALTLIYPGHAVRAGLLWTDQPLLTLVDLT